MKKYLEYIENVKTIIEKIEKDENGSIIKTAEIFADQGKETCFQVLQGNA